MDDRANISAMQAETRHRAGFPAFEASLPDPRPQHGILAFPLRDLLSRLGPLNPVALPVQTDDVVWLFDNTAHRGTASLPLSLSLPWPLDRIGAAVGSQLSAWWPGSAPGSASEVDQQQQQPWTAEFVAAVFDRDSRCAVVDTVADIAQRLGLAADAQERTTIEQRLTPFLMHVRPGRKIRIQQGDRELRLGPTGSGGVATAALEVGPPPPRPSSSHGGGGEPGQGKALVPPETQGILDLQTFYADPEGWAVISDIDDTIKVTMTSSPTGILRSTFVDDPVPIAGMPEFYSTALALLQSVSPPADRVPFFYLSASPYNLYSLLRPFLRDARYPPGQLLLRDSSWKTVAGLLSALTVGTREYKVGQMRRIRTWFPRRRFVCVGDSTQSDPEAYGQMYRESPAGWIGLILIRRVTDIAAVGIREKNEPARFERAFEGVPREVWRVFEDPGECVRAVEELVGARG